MITLILCWLAVGAGFIIGAAWVGLFPKNPDKPGERQ